MTSAELRSGTRLKKEPRDAIVRILAREGLLRVDGKMLTASTYSEFVAALYVQKDLPQVVDLRSIAEGQ